MANYDIKYNESLRFSAVYIQCTWANVFAFPEHIKGFCIRTYTRTEGPDSIYTLFFKLGYSKTPSPIGRITQTQIGILNGNYYTDEKGVVWLESQLVYCDRRATGWFRESDIWHKQKGIEPNSRDWEFIPYTPPVEPGGGDGEPEKKSNWLTWLLAGLSAMSILR